MAKKRHLKKQEVKRQAELERQRVSSNQSRILELTNSRELANRYKDRKEVIEKMEKFAKKGTPQEVITKLFANGRGSHFGKYKANEERDLKREFLNHSFIPLLGKEKERAVRLGWTELQSKVKFAPSLIDKSLRTDELYKTLFKDKRKNPEFSKQKEYLAAYLDHIGYERNQHVDNAIMYYMFKDGLTIRQAIKEFERRIEENGFVPQRYQVSDKWLEKLNYYTNVQEELDIEI